MPNRIIKETICTSENIDELSSFHEVVFYRLIVNCDDYGRMDARPKILASRLFPLKEIRAKQMEDALRALTSADLVTLYYVAGKPILQMNTWDRHQNVRAKKSKYPGPEQADGTGPQEMTVDSSLHTSSSNCMQMYADVPVIQSNTKSESNPNPNPTRAGARDADFERFWNEYPKKVGKAAALKAFAKVTVPVSVLIEAVRAQARSAQWTKDNGQYIPNPATWLNQGRWEDKLPEARGRNDVFQTHGTALSPMLQQAARELIAEQGGEDGE